MNKIDIIGMARDADADQVQEGLWAMQTQDLVSFANLVCQAERQRLHDVFMAIHHAQTHRNNYWRFAANQVLKCEDLPEFKL